MLVFVDADKSIHVVMKEAEPVPLSDCEIAVHRVDTKIVFRFSLSKQASGGSDCIGWFKYGTEDEGHENAFMVRKMGLDQVKSYEHAFLWLDDVAL